MKTIKIIRSVSIPNVPGFDEGMEVRVKGEMAEMLVERGFAKFSKEVQTTDEDKKRNDESVHVKQVGTKKSS